MKKIFSFILIICLCLSMCACGELTGYGVKTVKTLAEQDYGLAFRTGDSTIYYISAALQVLQAQGKISELNSKWFGSNVIDFGSDPEALNTVGMPEPRKFNAGVDIESFPFAYKDVNGQIWGYDIELGKMVCELLGWEYSSLEIKTENVYVELASGNIDCAWGGIAMDQEQLDDGKYEQLGPYIHNDVVIASRAGSSINSASQLHNKILAMSTSEEAMEYIQLVKNYDKKFSKISRVTGGAQEIFQNLYDNKCDVVLTDSTALLYFNHR